MTRVRLCTSRWLGSYYQRPLLRWLPLRSSSPQPAPPLLLPPLQVLQVRQLQPRADAGASADQALDSLRNARGDTAGPVSPLRREQRGDVDRVEGGAPTRSSRGGLVSLLTRGRPLLPQEGEGNAREAEIEIFLLIVQTLLALRGLLQAIGGGSGGGSEARVGGSAQAGKKREGGAHSE
jgi:hypothetical protein